MSDRRFDIAAVTRQLLGSPTSATRREWRFGARGSLSVRLDRGTWFDHEAGEGGGALGLVQRQLGCDQATAARWYRDHVEGRSAAPPAPSPRPSLPTPDPDALARRIERARAVWGRAQPAAGTVVQTYLKRRGLWLPADAPLRYLPDAWHHETRSTLPAMIAPIVPVDAMDNDAPQAIHLTYLAVDGTKAPAQPAKRVIGAKRGGCIKLSPDEDVTFALALSEGIETGLAGLARGLPTWACVDAGNLSAFPVLSGIETLHVLADHDPAGQYAAAALSTRWSSAGREVLTHLPGRLGDDWADQAQQHGALT